MAENNWDFDEREGVLADGVRITLHWYGTCIDELEIYLRRTGQLEYKRADAAVAAPPAVAAAALSDGQR